MLAAIAKLSAEDRRPVRVFTRLGLPGYTSDAPEPSKFEYNFRMRHPFAYKLIARFVAIVTIESDSLTFRS
jgi:hypothetical protein